MLRLSLEAGAIERAAPRFRTLAGQLTAVALERAVGQPAGELLVQRIKAAAPVRTGRLRDSIRLERGPGGWRIVAVSYAGYVVEGTRPHLIMPRVKRALWWPGAAHPVRSVQHPGTKANDFPRRALEQATPGLRLLLRGEGERLIRLVTE